MLLSFLFWQSLYRSCGYIASLCPVLSSAFFNAPELSRILWAVLDMPSTLSLLSICRSFVSVWVIPFSSWLRPSHALLSVAYSCCSCTVYKEGHLGFVSSVFCSTDWGVSTRLTYALCSYLQVSCSSSVYSSTRYLCLCYQSFALLTEDSSVYSSTSRCDCLHRFRLHHKSHERSRMRNQE